MGKNISLNRNYISIKEQDVLTQLIVVVCKTSYFFIWRFMFLCNYGRTCVVRSFATIF